MTDFILDSHEELPVDREGKHKDHEIAIHVNNLQRIAITYTGSQQLRYHIRKEVYRFMGKDDV